VPTLLMLNRGRVLEQRIGAAPRDVLHAFVLSTRHPPRSRVTA